MGFKKAVLEKSESTAVQFVRSLIVGGIATGVDVGIAMLLVYGFSVNEQLAAAIGFIFGLATNYILSAVWIFDKSKVTTRLGEFLVFAVIGAVGLLIKVGLITLFEKLMDRPFYNDWFLNNLNELIRNITATVIVFIYNFAARKLILYRNKPGKPENEKKEETVK
ncbi:MAG TPA: GtrA family protein [Oscillospiraceae bacterium]|mgnify:CR=1 FL=1|nr:GtrA family protein [Oscillospiraceae bacterium]HPS33948.1 GtrA family protein [Oscillospiraceae bacterium]